MVSSSRSSSATRAEKRAASGSSKKSEEAIELAPAQYEAPDEEGSDSSDEEATNF